MPRNPATICVSNTVAGTAPQAAMQDVDVLLGGVGHRHARAGEDTAPAGRGPRPAGSTRATLSAHAI